jgi:hypothetical protein
LEIVSNTLSYAGTALIVLLLYLLVRGPISRYFPLFLYTLTYFVATVAEAWILRTQGLESHAYFEVYWGGELLLDLLLCFTTLALTARALEGSRLRPLMIRFLLAVFLVAVIVPFVLFESPVFTTRWNNRTTELLNFGAAIMNLGLWSALLASRNRDRQLMLVTAGLGVALASAALTMAIRHYSQDKTVARDITDLAHRVLQIGSVLIWCWAFRPARKPAPAREPTASAG